VDFAHQTAHLLSARHGLIAVENLRVKANALGEGLVRGTGQKRAPEGGAEQGDPG
jgi:hypothetical protein